MQTSGCGLLARNEPTKTLGIYISYNRNTNNDQNIFIKLTQKMETKLNAWLSRDLNLMGRTLLVKALGIAFQASLDSLSNLPIQLNRSALTDRKSVV